MHLNLTQKYWLFSATVVMAALYIFEPTSNWQWVQKVMSLKIDPAPLISIKNLIAWLLAYMAYKVYDAGR